MSTKYYIEISNEYASNLWEMLTEFFNVIQQKDNIPWTDQIVTYL